MKILLLNDNDNKDLLNMVDKLKENIKLLDTNEKISIVVKYIAKQKYDVIVIITDMIDTVEKYKALLGKNMLNKLMIITGNLSSSFIINCIKITPNICYIKNDIDFLAKKVYSVYIKNESN